MNCPDCKSPYHVRAVRDAAGVLVENKKRSYIKPIEGYWCEMCCVNWMTKAGLKKAAGLKEKSK
jgi:hypothetical protein